MLRRNRNADDEHAVGSGSGAGGASGAGGVSGAGGRFASKLKGEFARVKTGALSNRFVKKSVDNISTGIDAAVTATAAGITATAAVVGVDVHLGDESFETLEDAELVQALEEFAARMEERREYNKKHADDDNPEAQARKEREYAGTEHVDFLDGLIGRIKPVVDAREEEADTVVDPIDTLLNDVLATDVVDIDDDDFDHMERWHELLLDVVTKRLSTHVVRSHDAFVTGLGQVQLLEADLQLSNFITRTGRRHLGNAERELREGALVVTHKFRMKSVAQEVVATLKKIQELSDNKATFQALMDSGDFTRARAQATLLEQLCEGMERVHVAKTLSISGDDVEKLFDKRVASTIKSLCRSYDEAQYMQVLESMRGARQLQELVDMITKEFTAAALNMVHTTAFTLVAGQPNQKFGPDALKDMPYEELVPYLHESQALVCLLQTCEVLCDLLHSFYLMDRFHGVRIAKLPPGQDDAYSVVGVALAENKPKFWNVIERKVSALVGAPKCTSWKLDRFLQFVYCVQKFISFGEEFLGTDAHGLRGSVRAQSKAYYESFHRDHILLTTNMLENEVWAAFPCDADFGLSSIRELHGFVQESDTFDGGARAGGGGGNGSGGAGSMTHMLSGFAKHGNPFTKRNTTANDHSKSKDVHKGAAANAGSRGSDNRQGGDADDEDDDDDAALLVESVDEDSAMSRKGSSGGAGAGGGADSGGHIESGPVFTSSALSVVKFIGHYVQIMEVLSPVASDAFLGAVELVHFYIGTVIQHFTPPGEGKASAGDGFIFLEADADRTSPKLRSTTLTIKNLLNGVPPPRKFPSVALNDFVELNASQTCHGLYERYCALSSVTFITDAMSSLRSRMLALLPPKTHRELERFYSETVETVDELHDCVLRRMPTVLMPMDTIVAAMEKVKWDTEDFGAYANTYIDELQKCYQRLVASLAQTQGRVPEKVGIAVLRYTIEYTMQRLVDGFSRAKKCSNEGRAMMSHDLETLHKALQQVTPIRPIPRVRYVDNYIKAFYMLEQDFVPWAHTHSVEYSCEQMVALVKCGVGQSMKKKAREALIAEIEKVFKV